MERIFKGMETFGFQDMEDLVLFEDKKLPEPEELAQQKKNQLEKVLVAKKQKCPVCKSDFQDWDVSSYRIRIEKTDTDLRSYYSPYDPLYYGVIICQECGYAATRSYFNKTTKKQSDLILSKITPNYRRKIYHHTYTIDDAIERHKYALLNTVIKEGKDSEKAMTCLKLSWLYREKEDSESESLFRQNALKGFLCAYEKEHSIPGMDTNTLQYLIGELNRREGNLEEAMKYIGSIIVNKDVLPRLKNRAIDVKELILEERKSRAMGNSVL